MVNSNTLLRTISLSALILISSREAQATTGTQCMMIVTYSEMASGQFKKAYKAKTTEEAKKFLKKGMDYAKQAAAYAPQCDCPQAETYALEAFAFAKKGQESPALEDLHSQAKKAMDLSIDAVSAAQSCNK